MCVNSRDFSNSKILQTEKNKIHHQWPLSRGLCWVGSWWNRLCPAISWNILTVRPLALLRIVGGRFGICSTPNAPNPPGGGSRAGQREKEEGFQKGRLDDSEEASSETVKYKGHVTLDVDKKELREPCFPYCILQHSTFRLVLDAAGLGSRKMIMNDYYRPACKFHRQCRVCCDIFCTSGL